MGDIDNGYEIWKATGKGKVSEDALTNLKLPVETRLQSIEFDLAVTSRAVHEIFTQQTEMMETQKKYMHYIDVEIEKAAAEAEFKNDLRKQLLKGGIFAVFSVVTTLLFLGFKEWVGKA